MNLKFELPPSGFKRLFYDIETSYCIGSFWRPSHKARINFQDIIHESAIICICWKWEGQETQFEAVWDKGDDKSVIERFTKAALEADQIVSHNGKRFDDKWVRTRAMVHGIPFPTKLESYDTCAKARSHFNLQSNRLDYFGKRFFDGGKNPMSKEDWDYISHPLVPYWYGHEVDLPDTYQTALDKMVTYCHQDIKLLEDTFHLMQPYVSNESHVGAHTGFGRYSCPNCANDKPHHSKKRTTKAGTVRHQLQCPDCKTYYTVSNKVWEEKLKADFNEKMAKSGG